MTAPPPQKEVLVRKDNVKKEDILTSVISNGPDP